MGGIGYHTPLGIIEDDPGDGAKRTFPTLTILGQTGVKPSRNLETFPAPTTVSVIVFKTDEFTSMCPITGQPDFQTITITYSPREQCLESKSLKLYLQTFRNEGAFCEQLAHQIADDIGRVLDPRFLQVTIDQKPRGGIALSASADYRGECDDDE